MTEPQELRAIDARLRTALSAHAQTIEPSGDGLQRIEERLMDTDTGTGTGTDSHDHRRRSPIWIGAAAAAAVVIGIVTFVAISDSDDSDVVADSTSTTSSTTEATTTTEAPFTADVDPYSVAYPGPLTSQRFDSPEPAAISYARDVLGFTELVTGEFQQGDSRSGELVVTDRDGGPETTILLRLMDDDTWFVLGSQTPNIVVDTPAAGDSISSPFATAGEALAYEGTVDVTVAPQDDVSGRGSDGFVTGSGTPPAGPFEDSIEFRAPSSDTAGIVIYRIHSAEDGHVTEATSFPVRLQAG